MGQESVSQDKNCNLFVQAGYMAIPSPRQPKPGKDKYYRGGYITQVIIMICADDGANEHLLLF